MRWKFVLAGTLWGLAVNWSAPVSGVASRILSAPIAFAAAQGSPTHDAAPRLAFRPPDYMEIDGSRNPELVPQWSAWGFAFRVIAGGSRRIPLVVARHLSEEEHRILLAAADADQRSDAGCQERVQRLYPLLFAGKIADVNENTREIQLDCRWQTLRTRDRVLEALNPEGRAALIQWVESTKSGMRVSVPKGELAHYQQPQ